MSSPSSPSSPSSDPIGFFDSSQINNKPMSIGDKEMQIIKKTGSTNKLIRGDYKSIVADLIGEYSKVYEIKDEYETKLDKIISHLDQNVAKGGKRSKRRRNTKRQSKRQSKRR